MSTSEIIYYIKGGVLSRLIAGTLQPMDDISNIRTDERYSVLIDDEYLFYMHMQYVSVVGKKLTNIINNYLASKIPAEAVRKSHHIHINGRILVYLISDELDEILKNNQPLFSSAQKVSSPFIEFLAKYQEFVFKDSKRVYKVTENDILNATDLSLDGVDARELLAEIDKISSAMRLPNVRQRSKIANYPFIVPAAVLLICFLFFVASNFLAIRTLAKNERAYENMLQGVYVAAGLKDAADPYGMLVMKSKRSGDGFDGMKILPILKELNDMKGDTITLRALNYRDKSVRVDGNAADFAALEVFQKKVETAVGKDVIMGDTKKDTKGVTFSMRYSR